MLGVSAAAALALVLAADLLDPEPFVVRHDVGRAAVGAELDVSYLSRLSDDALPAIAGALGDRPRAGSTSGSEPRSTASPPGRGRPAQPGGEPCRPGAS